MQLTQAEIILSFQPNYIPYISGASWGFSQLLQFLDSCSSSVPIRLLLPRSIIISKRIIYYQSSHCVITCKLDFLRAAFCAACDMLPFTIWVLLKGGNHWELPRTGSHTQKINSQLRFSSDGGIGMKEFFLLAVSHHPCKKHPHCAECLEKGNASHIPALSYASCVGGLIWSCGRKPLFSYSKKAFRQFKELLSPFH